MNGSWGNLKVELTALHARTPALQEFCTLPDVLHDQPVTPYRSAAADLMIGNPGATTPEFRAFRDALVAAAPHALWRETYKDTNIGKDFLSKFACYALIGADAPFAASNMRSFVVWQPPGLHYPWHHHPAEEMYLVVAGQAEFSLHGQAPRTLHPGDSIYHASNQPHALTNHAHPVMAYVLWRGDLTTKPVLTPPEMLDDTQTGVPK